MNEEQKEYGKLFLVSTPIGNKFDITLRAKEVLKSVDLVICENMKAGANVLKDINIKKTIDTLNVKNELEQTLDFVEMLKKGQSLALISDAGTPVFADPGLTLVKNTLSQNIDVIVVPGPSSIMAALVRSTFNIDSFLFAGFLNREPIIREKELRRLSNEKRTVVLFETPYRFKAFLRSASRVLPDRNAYIGMNLTMPFETHHYGTFRELYQKFEDSKIKAEFVVVFEGAKGSPQKINKKYNNINKLKKR